MQFHHHGYVSTDPRVQPARGAGIDRSPDLPETMDVLVVGAGPAGYMAAAQLSQFPEASTYLVDRRPGRLEIGHADGVQQRSVETFQAFGFAHEIMDEAYRITETCFWKPDPDDPSRIHRAARTPDDPMGISEFPHLIVNQARILDNFATFMRNSPSRSQVTWGWEYVAAEVTDAPDHPVHVTLRRSTGPDEGAERVVRTRYLVGGDGARSRVRRDIGAVHLGQVANHAWGVMDVLADTDFPDIRTKCIIHSAAGSILHIPREGGYLFRSYVDLGEVPADDDHKVRTTPLETIIGRANAILHPYSLDVREVCWWSVYEVGHRVTDRFDDVPADAVGTRHPRVFIAGDACHTHSAKAGQGMNVSMQDTFNLGWKLGQVLRGLSDPSLLATYTAERQAIAQDLIDFDSRWSAMMARRPEGFASPTELEDFYVSTAEFPAGFMTQYRPSSLIGTGEHQDLATGYPIGKRFRSAPVVRRSDANPVELGHLHRADGRWRLYVFADATAPGQDGPVARWARWMADAGSPLHRHTPAGWDVDGVLDIKVVYQQDHTTFDVTDASEVFLPRSGGLGLRYLDNVFATDPDRDVFTERGLARTGVVVLVRPDMYVAQVLPLDATDELADFLAGVFLDQHDGAKIGDSTTAGTAGGRPARPTTTESQEDHS